MAERESCSEIASEERRIRVAKRQAEFRLQQAIQTNNQQAALVERQQLDQLRGANLGLTIRYYTEISKNLSWFDVVGGRLQHNPLTPKVVPTTPPNWRPR